MLHRTKYRLTCTFCKMYVITHECEQEILFMLTAMKQEEIDEKLLMINRLCAFLFCTICSVKVLSLGFRNKGMLYDYPKHNYRDIFVQGYCDDTVKKFAKLLRWDKDLQNLIDKVEKKTKSKIENFVGDLRKDFGNKESSKTQQQKPVSSKIEELIQMLSL